MTKMPLVNLGLNEGQNCSKLHQTTFFMFSHHTWGYQRFSSTLTKFDLKLTPSGDQKPNFDLTLRTSWNQHHCEEYWIPSPMTAHGSNVELKRLRYLENRTMHVNSLPEQWTKCTHITKNYPVWTKCMPSMEGMHLVHVGNWAVTKKYIYKPPPPLSSQNLK